MLASQRQSLIMDGIRRSGAARVADLTDELGVSDMTIRRDLEQLARTGLVRKVHGGAVLTGNATEEPGFEAKSSREQPAKEAIARLACSLIRPGTAIALSAGTTTWSLAGELTQLPRMTIVTNSTTVADLIAARSEPPAHVVILTGGVRTPSAALVGPVADLTIRSLHVDQLFIGVHGMDPVAGLTTPNLAEAETNRTLIACAKQVVVCADSTKWGNAGLASFGPLSAADVLISDSGLPAEARRLIAAEVSELMIADVPA